MKEPLSKSKVEWESGKLSQSEVWPRFDVKCSIFFFLLVILFYKQGQSHWKTPRGSLLSVDVHNNNLDLCIYRWLSKWFLNGSLNSKLNSHFFPLVYLSSSHRSWMTSWMTCRTLSRSFSVSRGLFRCPVPWTNRTSSMTSCRCLRAVLSWLHSRNTGASDPAWDPLVSPFLSLKNRKKCTNHIVYS